jgi:hypothetical protein
MVPDYSGCEPGRIKSASVVPTGMVLLWGGRTAKENTMMNIGDRMIMAIRNILEVSMAWINISIQTLKYIQFYLPEQALFH